MIDCGLTACSGRASRAAEQWLGVQGCDIRIPGNSDRRYRISMSFGGSLKDKAEVMLPPPDMAYQMRELGIKDPNGYALILGEDISKKWRNLWYESFWALLPDFLPG
jgi:hypothetical protein